MNSVNINIPNLKEGQILQIEMVEGKILISMRNNQPHKRQDYQPKPFRRNWRGSFTKKSQNTQNPTFRVNIPKETPRTEIRKPQKIFRNNADLPLDEIIRDEEKKPYNMRKYLK